MRAPGFLTALVGVMLAVAIAHSADDPQQEAAQNAAKQQQAPRPAQPSGAQQPAQQQPTAQPQPTQQQQQTRQQQVLQSQQSQQQMGQTGPVRPAPAIAPIHQEVDFTASPARVYEALLNSVQFAAFSGRPAVIDRTVGGAASLFGGHIVARNLELVPNQRIVQGWRVVTWPEGVWSIARFELQPKGTGTHLAFDHSSFPDGQRDHLAQGWGQNYWSLLKKYLK